MFLGEVFEAMKGVTTVIHDDACHLRKYASRREGQSDLARRLAFPNTRYIVDRFHARGHVDIWCKQNCMHDSPDNVHTWEQARCGAERTNCSICEQLFSKVGRHKFVVSKMGRATSMFYLHEVFELRNKYAQSRLPVP